MSTELSFEDFFAAGTGAETTEKFVISSEGFDGYSDNVMAEAEQALENLNFLDSFEAVSRMNAETKIRMLQKIKNNYNSKTIGRENLGMSIESLCASQIQSLEDAMADKTPAGDKAKTNDTPATNSKAKEFFKAVWGGIKNFFIAIRDFFADIGRSIAKFFSKFKRADKDVDPATVADATAGASGDEKAIVNAAAKASIVNATLDNVNKFQEYSDRLKKIADEVSKVAASMENADEKKFGADSVALQKSVAEFLKKSAKIQMLYGKAFNAVSKAAANTLKVNKILTQWKNAKENNGKSEAQIKSDGIKKFLNPGEIYIIDPKINTTVSEELIRKSDALCKGIKQLSSGINDQKVVELRKISEDINKLVLGNKANYDVSTIDDKQYTMENIFGVKTIVVGGSKASNKPAKK